MKKSCFVPAGQAGQGTAGKSLDWVAESLRGRGHGRRLLEAAEALAIERGCLHAFLESFSFQAPLFYQKLGYEVFGEADDWPVGHTHYFLRKPLASKS